MIPSFLPYLTFFVFLLYTTASPNPYPAVVSLPSRPSPVTDSIQQIKVEHDLLPFVLISTIDGALHAVDRGGGRVRWTLKDGVEPLVGGGVKGNSEREEYIVEPLSGGLFIFEEAEDGYSEDPPKIRKLPLSVEQL